MLNCKDYGFKDYFLCGMRFYFGIWLLYVGLTKWLLFGPTGFLGFLTPEFDKTWVPHQLTVVLGWLILIAEPGLALLILSGARRRTVWALTSLFMFMLTIGQTILMKPEVIVTWQYLVLTLACASLCPPDEGCCGAKKQDRTA